MPRPAVTLALVCARSSSAGVPGKNFRDLNGKPLIDWTYQHALDAALVDCVGLVTNRFYQTTVRATKPVYRILRTEALDGPRAKKWDVWRWAIETFERGKNQRIGVAVDLDVTRPIRHPDDVDAVVRAVLFGGADAAIAVAPSRRNPYQDVLEVSDGRLNTCKVVGAGEPVYLRQEAPPTFDHGGITAVSREYLFAAGHLFDGMIQPVLVDKDTIWDINDESEWVAVEAIHRRSAHGWPSSVKAS